MLFNVWPKNSFVLYCLHIYFKLQYHYLINILFPSWPLKPLGEKDLNIQFWFVDVKNKWGDDDMQRKDE